jgi:hypothetical protein
MTEILNRTNTRHDMIRHQQNTIKTQDVETELVSLSGKRFVKGGRHCFSVAGEGARVEC